MVAVYDLRDGCLWSTCSSKFCRKSHFLQFFSEQRCLWPTVWPFMSYNGCSWATFLRTQLLLSYSWPFWGSKPESRWHDRIFRSTTFVGFLGPQGFLELPFVRLVFTSHIALKYFHAVGVLFLCSCFSLPSPSLLPFKKRKKRRRIIKTKPTWTNHWLVQVVTQGDTKGWGGSPPHRVRQEERWDGLGLLCIVLALLVLLCLLLLFFVFLACAVCFWCWCCCFAYVFIVVHCCCCWLFLFCCGCSCCFVVVVLAVIVAVLFLWKHLFIAFLVLDGSSLWSTSFLMV